MEQLIKEKADNYMRGRAMAMSFKPLTLQDVKDAYEIGAEEMRHIDTDKAWKWIESKLKNCPELFNLELGRSHFYHMMEE